MDRVQSKPLAYRAALGLALSLALAPSAFARTHRHPATKKPHAVSHPVRSPRTPSPQSAPAAEPLPSAVDYTVAARVHAWVAAQHGIQLAEAAPDNTAVPGTSSVQNSNAPAVLPTALSAAPPGPIEHGHLFMPAALKGSHEVLVHQNEMADAEGLSRIRDDADLRRMVAAHELVPIPASSMLHVDDRLPANRRYCRPWVAQFLTEMARAHYARFHAPLQVNSAVRTVDFQRRLLRTNGNAAPIAGDTASPHLTGIAIDIAKKPLSEQEVAWMRAYLLPLQQSGKLDVEEEFQQACFHMSVYRKYAPAPQTDDKPAATEQAKPSAPERPAPRHAAPVALPAAAIAATILQ